jgi:CubicO group peptidase (beta-lactamase class C family)
MHGLPFTLRARARFAPGILSTALALAFAPAAFASDPAISYPGSSPGAHARAWFVANAAGEAAMRAFWSQHGDSASLAEHPVEERVTRWRQIRGQLGAATPLAVLRSGDDFIDMRTRDGSGALIVISFRCASSPPHGVVGIMVQPDDGGAGPPPGGPAGAAPGAAPSAGPPPTDREIVASLALPLDSLARGGAFSGAALLVKGDSVLFQHAYGLASREKQVPNQLETRFNLGSINKIFTAVAIQQLAEGGKLSLDSTIDRYLPDYPKDKGSQITVRQLLDHRGGVPDVFGERYERAGAANIKTMADWYALIREEPLRFPPGTQQQYSNGGYVLLGEIIEHLSGESYYEYVRHHVYEPAGMTRTEHLMNASDDPARAISYTRVDDSAPPTPAELPGRGSPAGGGYSTVGDLVRFAQALRTGKLIKGTYAPRMVGPQAGLGIAGGSPGVNGMLQLSGPYVLAILANTDPPAAERFMDTTGRDIMRVTGGQPGIRVGGGH